MIFLYDFFPYIQFGPQFVGVNKNDQQFVLKIIHKAMCLNWVSLDLLMESLLVLKIC